MRGCAWLGWVEGHGFQGSPPESPLVEEAGGAGVSSPGAVGAGVTRASRESGSQPWPRFQESPALSLAPSLLEEGSVPRMALVLWKPGQRCARWPRRAKACLPAS